MQINKVLHKIEQARSSLCATGGSLTSPMVVKASQELDKYIVAYYKRKGICWLYGFRRKAVGN